MTVLPDFNPEDVIATEVVEPEEAATEHSASRRTALQVLYEVDCTGHPLGEVTAMRIHETKLSKKSGQYVRRFVMGVRNNYEKLDDIIRQYAPEWPLEQVAIVDRNILRMAVYEFMLQSKTPPRVVISEAIELANLFGAEGSSRFVNGVLGTLVQDYDKLRLMFSPAVQAEETEEQEEE